ncbi:heavy metal-associated isoprenylated plant protein 41-like [Malania oleifera]|uniref:heavy metal-associated isoprenylated plant protein 41-like n=1 Tax=Malania oleifera TaxID=397392 RepID=UPI0025AE70AC|nr:heavy metal-associated isoprenylated plant protein 41-like [Malania oleifera]
MGVGREVEEDKYITEEIDRSEEEEEEDAEDETEEEEEEEEEEDDDEYQGETEQKWIKHYSSSHRILLVGEGDFSFALSLATAFGSARNLVATSLDSLESVEKKYEGGIRNVRKIEEKGGVVLFGVDAKQMSQHFFLRTQRFDRIVYNFPHVGFLFREHSYCQIQLNKALVKGFLKNSKVLLKKETEKEEGGEIHVTHKEGEPYNKWDLVRKAEKIGLVLQEAVAFCKDDYPGYNNKRAHGGNSDAAFHLGYCTTFKFRPRR